MKYSKVYSAQNNFLSSVIVTIETDIANGLHSFSIVGLGDKAVDEAKDRVSAAIKNIGFVSPKQKNQKVIVSLAPADTRKEGSHFDLGIAIGYLIASGEISPPNNKTLYLGELALDGALRRVFGVLPIVQKAKEIGFTEVIVPHMNAEEAAVIDGVSIISVHHISEVIDHITKKNVRSPQPKTDIVYAQPHFDTDMKDIRGQENAKRGIEIAAAGRHNIALYGPPGTGKTMLAKALWSILPPLKTSEVIEVNSIHSVVGMISKKVITHPPFRSPHHTSSYASMVGGGTCPRPGEITLAHRGLLFLDEFPEFDKVVIESLRQPLEEKKILIARAKSAVEFPADCILIATMNPCPCGYIGSHQKECTCTPADIKLYQKKLSGPIVDRIDMWIEVSTVEYEKLSSTFQSENSYTVSERVRRSRAYMENTDIVLRKDIEKLLTDSAKKLKLSARAYYKTVKIARTIASLEKRGVIEAKDILEALQYRPKI